MLNVDILIVIRMKLLAKHHLLFLSVQSAASQQNMIFYLLITSDLPTVSSIIKEMFAESLSLVANIAGNSIILCKV